MTRDEVVELLGYRLGNRKDMAPHITAEMKLIQSVQLEGHSWLPWFLEKDLAQATTLSGSERVALPVDFLEQVPGRSLYLIDSGGVRTKLEFGLYEELLEQYPGYGLPQAWCVEDDFILLFPVPQAVYTLDWRYYSRDVDMTANNVETKWLKYAADLVLAEVGKILAEKHLQNPTLSASFAADVPVCWNRLYARHTAREDANQSIFMGGLSE